MKIKIIRGIYGHFEDGRIVEKTKANPPFEVNEEEGKRLIAAKVAKKEEDVAVTGEDECEEPVTHDNKEGGRVTGYLDREMLDAMEIAELRRLAGEMGLKKTGGKEELVRRISESPVHVGDDENDDGDLAGISPADPE